MPLLQPQVSCVCAICTELCTDATAAPTLIETTCHKMLRPKLAIEVVCYPFQSVVCLSAPVFPQIGTRNLADNFCHNLFVARSLCLCVCLSVSAVCVVNRPWWCMQRGVYEDGAGSCFVKWCGLLINAGSLELQADYTRYAGLPLSSTLTVPLSKVITLRPAPPPFQYYLK